MREIKNYEIRKIWILFWKCHISEIKTLEVWEKRQKYYIELKTDSKSFIY